MSDQQLEFNFDKFVKDQDVRQEKNIQKRSLAQHIIDEDIRRRRRAELYHEKWQNSIRWER